MSHIQHAKLILLLALSLLTGCAAGAPATADSMPTPSLAAVFERAVQTPTPTNDAAPTAAPAATPPPAPTPVPLAELPIYTDTLSGSWSLEQTAGMTYTLTARRDAGDGRAAIAARPNRDFGLLFFTVRQRPGVAFPRSQVLGVSFLLSSDQPIGTGDLAVTVLGSNDQPFWRAGDDSARVQGRDTSAAPLFSETRLYDLEISREIPAGEWVEVVVWLDRLLYDPDYRYVTGLYIKNDAGFRQTFYVDRLALLAQPADTP
ncbi:MAG TPA: hypothetical protein VFS21_19940 [Roseiflexaceae bacterium]|nr:hypothetical protein [Roseiflexaceae bacterium]